MRNSHIVLVAGGTGGHIFPASALGQELKKCGYTVSIFTDVRGQDYPWDPSFQIHAIPSCQMRDSVSNVLKGLFGLVAGFFKAKKELKKSRPDAVVGFGGYASLTTLFAAWTLKIPTMIHQSDALLGRANRILAPFVTRIATSFHETAGIKPNLLNKVTVTGLPLRKGITSQKYVHPNQNFHLLVIGGSQGAKFFGELVPEAIKCLSPEDQGKWQIAHQCRPESFVDVEHAYAKTKAQVELSRFFDDMPNRYRKSHLVISRAGASSVLEIATVGRPAIFVPYPFATDDHQTLNAKQALNVGGAWTFQQGDLTPEILARQFKILMKHPQDLADAANNILQVSIPHGEAHLVKAIEELIHKQTQKERAA